MLHVVPAGTLPARNQVLLGDCLRGHRDGAARYGALIRELTGTARAERGRPPAPV